MLHLVIYGGPEIRNRRVWEVKELIEKYGFSHRQAKSVHSWEGEFTQSDCLVRCIHWNIDTGNAEKEKQIDFMMVIVEMAGVFTQCPECNKRGFWREQPELALEEARRGDQYTSY